MKKLSILFLISCSLRLAAQHYGTGSIFILHPSIGAHILPEEKKRYALFPEYADSCFLSAQFVQYQDSTFTTLYRLKNREQVLEKTITLNELQHIYEQIEQIDPAPETAGPKPEEEKNKEKYRRFIKTVDVASDVLGYTVLWSVRLLNVALGGEWK